MSSPRTAAGRATPALFCASGEVAVAFDFTHATKISASAAKEVQKKEGAVTHVCKTDVRVGVSVRWKGLIVGLVAAANLTSWLGGDHSAQVHFLRIQKGSEITELGVVQR